MMPTRSGGGGAVVGVSGRSGRSILGLAFQALCLRIQLGGLLLGLEHRHFCRLAQPFYFQDLSFGK